MRNLTIILLVCTLIEAFVTNSSIYASTDQRTNGRNERTILNFNNNWGFYRGDLTGAERVDFDDSAFANVTIPHTMRLEKKHATGASDVYQGIGWYRRYFTIDESLKGKAINIDFEGVMMDSDVYLNGDACAAPGVAASGRGRGRAARLPPTAPTRAHREASTSRGQPAGAKPSVPGACGRAPPPWSSGASYAGKPPCHRSIQCRSNMCSSQDASNPARDGLICGGPRGRSVATGMPARVATVRRKTMTRDDPQKPAHPRGFPSCSGP